ncbi:MAG: hypothetical protein CVU05_04865 [Bacteroidetes bacterium HGW-Bacteroidetes-21]|jgi:hypothetical protein|nr:MAG: hypothetical protein CVU05_04865 [Bacteroidetes bacterium HGW-Bacteroidetes-21]
MKKTLLFLLIATFSVSVFGQMVQQVPDYKLKKSHAVKDDVYHLTNQMSTKAFGDTLWQNDFSNASDWVISNETSDNQNWVISTSTDPSIGYNTGPITSTTAANGYALFDSDAVGTTAGTQNAHITTASPLDFTGVSGIAITFQQRYRRWQTTVVSVGISTDGTTWTYIPVNVGVPMSTAIVDDINLNLSTYCANQPQVWIRFNYQGNWDYAWMIDDIYVIEAADNEILIEKSWATFSYRAGFYSMMPRRQVQPIITYKTAIFNNGNNDQTNIDLGIEVFKGTELMHTLGSTGVHAQLNSLLRDTIWGDTSFTTIFEPELDMRADYSIVYTVTQAETDQMPLDNIDTLHFSVVDSVLARDTRRTTYTGPARYTDGVDGDFIGVRGYVPYSDTVASISCWITSNSLEGGSIIGRLYEVTSTDYVPVLETNMYDLDSTDLGGWLTLPYITDGVSELTADDAFYIWGIETYWQTVDPNGGIYVGADNAGPHEYNYSSSLRLGTDWYYIDQVPMCRLNFKYVTPESVGTLNTNNLNVAQNFPNPANNNTEISYSLKTSENVSLTVTDITGKAVASINLGKQNDGKHNYSLNTSNFESGIYFYTLTAGNNSKNMKMTVVK